MAGLDVRRCVWRFIQRMVRRMEGKNMAESLGWGGKRKGAGRPKGTAKNESRVRPQHQLRAFDDEWELIKRFARQVKHGEKAACEAALAKLENPK